MDYGPLEQQLEYVKTMKMPYSAIIFSGNKSLHFLVSLNVDLVDEATYRLYSKWILNIMNMADQNTVNPSRSIRVPGGVRENGGVQKLWELGSAITLEDLDAWLEQHPDARPYQRNESSEISSEPDFSRLSRWVVKQLVDGFDPGVRGRNKTWFAIGCDFCRAGYSLDEALDILLDHFVSERDFKLSEWRAAIKSGYKYISMR